MARQPGRSGKPSAYLSWARIWDGSDCAFLGIQTAGLLSLGVPFGHAYPEGPQVYTDEVKAPFQNSQPSCVSELSSGVPVVVQTAIHMCFHSVASVCGVPLVITEVGRGQDFGGPLPKAMATHSSTLAWKIPWTEGPGGLQSMGSLRVGHN